MKAKRKPYREPSAANELNLNAGKSGRDGHGRSYTAEVKKIFGMRPSVTEDVIDEMKAHESAYGTNGY